jgi:hypothetical protein
MLILAMFGLAGSVAFTYAQQNEAVMNTHLTIFVTPELVEQGGLVIVSGVSVPQADWDLLPKTNSLALLDPANPKARQVADTDKHFGVVVSEPVTRVEFLYPEQGSYSFNFLVDPSSGAAPELVTSRISVGNSTVSDLDTGEMVTRDSESSIAIIGAGRPEAWARQAEVWFYTEATFENRETLILRVFEAGRTVALRPERVTALEQDATP